MLDDDVLVADDEVQFPLLQTIIFELVDDVYFLDEHLLVNDYLPEHIHVHEQTFHKLVLIFLLYLYVNDEFYKETGKPINILDVLIYEDLFLV